MPLPSYKNNSDNILELFNPLIISSIEDKILSSNIFPVENNDSSSLNSVTSEILQLNLKPSFKAEKKSKKLEKDEEVEISKVKSKLKKKFREKIELYEDDESTSDDEKKINNQIDISFLSLQRATKPQDNESISQLNLSKASIANSSIKKKKSLQPVLKKDADVVPIMKPESITISSSLTVQDLSQLFVVSETDIIKKLFLKGIVVTLNTFIDTQTCVILGHEFGIQVTIDVKNQESTEIKVLPKQLDNNNAQVRPPIVTVMGHVDHGKTTLLDKIRKTQVAQKESGGITQKLGAYEVDVTYKGETRKLVFLDTPGHEAFSGMRNRGIKVTDIAILVVAADDGVRPQTIEAINCIKNSGVPLIVAINKIDKEDANVENIKQELVNYNIIAESWGGDTLMVPISAKQGTNIDTLLEMVLLLTEVENFTANPYDNAEGTILESHIDRAKGPVASVLVQNGSLKVGDIIVSQDVIGKIRGIVNSNGDKLLLAPPSSPVMIWGLSKPPTAGQVFSVYLNEKEAKLAVQQAQVNLEKFNLNNFVKDNSSLSDAAVKGIINLIIKADIQGSLEAIVTSLNKISVSEVPVKILYASSGEITETDIEFARTSGAQILAFNTTLASGASKASKMSNIIIKQYSVIYDLFDYVQGLVDSIIGPEYDEQFLGSAIVKSIFPLGKSYVAGVKVTEGKVIRSSHVKVIRNNQTIYQGILSSLKRLKDEVLEVKEPLECGVFLKDFDTWEENDIVKAFSLVEKKKIKSDN